MKPVLLAVLATLLLTACWGPFAKPTDTGTGTTVSVGTTDDEKSIGTEKYRVAVPEGGEDKYTSVQHGKETWFAIGALAGVDDVNANGVAQAHFFTNGVFAHSFQLNIERPEDGYFYEAWLTDGTDRMVSTGHLRSHFGDTRHFLNFEINRDLRDLLQVVVTLEADDGNPQPGERVAEALLKVTQR